VHLSQLLEEQGHRVCHCTTLASAAEVLMKNAEDCKMMIVDLCLPDGDGEQVLLGLGPFGPIALLVISQYATPLRKRRSLRLGADDVLAKPFDSQEFLLRVEAILRRPRSHWPTTHSLTTADLNATLNSLSFSPKEQRIVDLLQQKANQFVSRSEIERAVWGEGSKNSRVLHVLIWRIRKTLEDHGIRITTGRGQGYKLHFD
jgi:DNA-binding response OmpR family regulator